MQKPLFLKLQADLEDPQFHVDETKPVALYGRSLESARENTKLRGSPQAKIIYQRALAKQCKYFKKVKRDS